MAIGRYDVVVRAYDLAGNFYQATTQLSVVNPLFELVGANGLRIEGALWSHGRTRSQSGFSSS